MQALVQFHACQKHTNSNTLRVNTHLQKAFRKRFAPEPFAYTPAHIPEPSWTIKALAHTFQSLGNFTEKKNVPRSKHTFTDIFQRKQTKTLWILPWTFQYLPCIMQALPYSCWVGRGGLSKLLENTVHDDNDDEDHDDAPWLRSVEKKKKHKANADIPLSVSRRTARDEAFC